MHDDEKTKILSDTQAVQISSDLVTAEPEIVEGGQKFGTFQGVFRPTILTILGVMMYLREGWLVGNAGLLGAILIILCCYAITGATALAISSITTNVRMGSGGVFSLISQSLGLEVGGSIGLPLYLAQGISTAMYLYGFAEGWQYLFADYNHPEWAVLLIAFTSVFLLAYFSASVAFRVQIVVMVGIVIALASIFLGAVPADQLSLPWADRAEVIRHQPVLWGGFEDESFWMLFAVFFPAATGIMVGASMSGNLKAPRLSIPRGTLAAWGVSLGLYIALAVWYSYVASPEELRTNLAISIDRAFWKEAVLIGVLASCFTAAISSLVAAPRVLQALASHEVVPFYHHLRIVKDGEPRNATMFTGALVLFVLFAAGNLNNIAKILTMFFLITYFTINVILVIEQSLNMISFRPQFAIPKWVPIIGSLLCLLAMIIISPVFGALAIMFVVAIYIYLDRANLHTPWETVNSGLFSAIANWAAKRVFVEGHHSVQRAWKPDVLVPTTRKTQLEGYFRLLCALTKTQGSIQVVGFKENGNTRALAGLSEIVQDFQREGLFATSAVIESANFQSSLTTCVSVMDGSFFRPNTIFASIADHNDDELQRILDTARANRMAVVFLAPHPEAGLGRERSINLWIRDQSPDWKLGLKLANLDYAVLSSYQLRQNWRADMRILCAVSKSENVEAAREFIVHMMELARMSRNIKIDVEHAEFNDFLCEAQRADLNIFGLGPTVNRDFMEHLVTCTRGSCLFVLDSGAESALA
jgi:amino acid transporter